MSHARSKPAADAMQRALRTAGRACGASQRRIAAAWPASVRLRGLRAIQSSPDEKCYNSMVRRFPSMSLRPAGVAGVVVALLLSGFGWALLESNPAHPGLQRQAAASLTHELGLTDLVLVTEARYLRHISVADRHSAFQDHPLALEHFPSGAALGVPLHLRAPDAPGARP